MADSLTPEPADAAEIEAGRVLFAQACDFVIGCARLDQVPDMERPEIAFAGRSNVGKSSLINALTGHKALARTSNTPGRTQQINFFDLGGRLMLADLPGYGYARAPKAQVKQWTGLVEAYLAGRANLRRTLVLVDSRHGLKDNDRSVMMMLDKAAQPYQVVLTKVDKIKAGALEDLIARAGAELAKHPAAHPVIAPTSSEKGTGIPELRAALAQLA
ncbi:MAG: ribosome biogenesis GTP-binding protein YihA/YsxC [Magnetovibrio sp.]|nr:ribosome biogenesis GTP-binding protein YihA/YsxC [Magnetovibrio sp.]